MVRNFFSIGGPMYVNALTAINEAIRLRPEQALYHRERGEIYLINWEPEKARLALQEAVRRSPDNAEFRSRLGIAELRCRNEQIAFQLVRSAIALAPDNHPVYNNAGQVFLFGGELDEAANLFREALRRFPVYEYFQRQLANCERERVDREARWNRNLRYTPLVFRQKGRKRFFDEDTGTAMS